jgi:phage-related protein
MNITFDNVGLNNAPYSIKNIRHEQSSPREIYLQNLSRERGAVLVGYNYRPKEIVIVGRITGTDKVDLETKIDAFKEILSRDNKNLDIDYATGTRRYVAYADDVIINRDYFHINYAPFEVKFIVPSGVGKDITATVDTINGTTTATKTGTLHVDGSAFPNPTIKLTLTAVTAVTALSFLCNGDKITLTQTLLVNDVIIIDTENKKVTVNGVEKDYTGMFASFVVGDNAWQIDLTRTVCTYNIEISYFKKFL